MNNNNPKGAVKTFYHFRRTMTSEAALKWLKEFINRERPQYAANPLCISTRKVMDKYYDKESQGD